MIKRLIEDEVDTYVHRTDKKILFIWGPRRSGKTTLLKKLKQKYSVPIFNFDLLSDRQKFVPDRDVLRKLAQEHKILLIDEVQNSPESTIALKILYDEFDVKVIATGSSELRQKSAKEFDSLAGRFVDTYCLPLSINEIEKHDQPKEYEKAEYYQKLANTLQNFGCYPEVHDSDLSEKEKIELLENIVETYVLKDVIDIYNLKNVKLAHDILRKIALQLGSEVSMREIANSLQANVQTVSNYIEIFIKNYILIPLPSFKTNIRKSVSENRKLYFYDLGVRNALVRDFRDLNFRPDTGGLWENFIVSELEKMKRNHNIKITMYFYREYGGQEVDIVIEDYHKKYLCLEIKKKKNKVKSVFPIPHSLQVIHTDNYTAVLSGINQ
mgnify:CR=1 FL=1